MPEANALAKTRCNTFICKIQIKTEGLLSEISVRFHQTFDQNLITLNLLCLPSELRLSLCLFTDLVAQRGEKLELLIDKTENLVDSVSLKIKFCHIYPTCFLMHDILQHTGLYFDSNLAV